MGTDSENEKSPPQRPAWDVEDTDAWETEDISVLNQLLQTPTKTATSTRTASVTAFSLKRPRVNEDGRIAGEPEGTKGDDNNEDKDDDEDAPIVRRLREELRVLGRESDRRLEQHATRRLQGNVSASMIRLWQKSARLTRITRSLQAENVRLQQALRDRPLLFTVPTEEDSEDESRLLSTSLEAIPSLFEVPERAEAKQSSPTRHEALDDT